MGPERDGVWRETGIVEAIPASGLPVKWRVPIAGGYSGPAVAAGRVYVTDFKMQSGTLLNNPGSRNELSGNERIWCLDANDGTLVWKYEYDCPYRLSYAVGPRATPTIADGRVYALGAMGNLTCLNAADGAVLWGHDLAQEYSVEVPIWGFCGHPLVDGDTVYCLVGGDGSVAVAFDAATGKEKWRALSAKEPGYCPPTMIEAGGTRQLLIWHPESINSLNPQTGEVYWSIPLEPNYGMSIMAPQISGGYLFASGIGDVGALLRLDRNKPAADVVWRSDATTGVHCANSTPLIHEGTIYGCECKGGQLRGVDLLTGKRLWETLAPTSGTRRPASHGTAFLVRHDERYFLFSETGDLILANLTPEAYEEIGRFHVLDPTSESFGRAVVWSHPAFANRCVFARNDKELVCVSLSADE
ncbi:MAG: PQQ-binding-like beta-propeller repeat protein [Planctomycetaceae bacterium]|nr:PQQ-binding-like beta-propeller repeat protein [Planctomycetaceae bacterium]